MAKKRDEDWTLLPFAAALAYLRELRPMSDDDFAILEAEIVETAFVLSRMAKMNMLQWVLEKLDQANQAGETLATFDASIEQVLTNAMSPAQVDAIFTSSAQYQYGAGSWQQGTDFAQADDTWGWRYETMHDDRVRLTHALLDGSKFALGEGRSVFPPWEWGCRCSAKWITYAEAGVNPVSATLPPAVETALDDSTYASPALEVPYQPDLSGFSPAILADYANDQALVN